jgi:hypothetical protein
MSSEVDADSGVGAEAKVILGRLPIREGYVRGSAARRNFGGGNFRRIKFILHVGIGDCLR